MERNIPNLEMAQSRIWCCAFRSVNGGKEVRDRVINRMVVGGKEDSFIAECAREMVAYLREQMPKAAGKQKLHVGAVTAVFRFSPGKRAEPLDAHKDLQISLAQLLSNDLRALENAFAIAIATVQ